MSCPARSLPSLRTLLLHNNHLGLLSGAVFSSLPSLEEVSLHSNPLRCDCGSSWGAHLGNRSHLKLLESAATLCSSPRRLAGRELREVAAEAGWGGADSCPPRISPSSFPPALNVSAGQPLALECWADAHPAPQLYWVTPAGDKVRHLADPPPLPPRSQRGGTLIRSRRAASWTGSAPHPQTWICSTSLTSSGSVTVATACCLSLILNGSTASYG